jgi:hypothetical protein
MPRKAVLLFTLLALTACFLSYKLGSSPVAYAKSHPAQQDSPTEGAAPPPLPPPPAEWVVFSAPGVGSLASVTKPGGGAGVQHVADCVSASVTAFSGSGGGVSRAVLYDLPVTGGAHALAEWVLPVPASGSGGGSLNLCGVSIVGTFNGGMELTFDSFGPSVIETVDIIGHDAT